MVELSDLLKQLKPSATFEISRKAKALQANKCRVIDLSIGEPHFPTPKHIIEATKESLDTGNTKYGPVAGQPKLREAISQKLKNENGLDYSLEQVVVSCGAKHALFNVFKAILNPGDEVLIPVPYWVSYPEQIKQHYGVPVFAENLEIEGLERLVSDRTKAIVINSPNNPTGAVLPKKKLEEIAEFALRYDLFIISDEIYEKIVYDAEHHSIGSFSKEILNRTFSVNGLSKTYAMTGFRIGYAAGPKDFMKAIFDFQSQVTSNIPVFVQDGAYAALTGKESEAAVKKMVDGFRELRDLTLSKLNKIRMVSYDLPQGAFYVFPKIPGVVDSKRFAEKLLEHNGLAVMPSERTNKTYVAVVPGGEFGAAEGHIRISYATSKQNIIDGLRRISEFC